MNSAYAHCHSRKPDSRISPLVRMSRSTSGIPAVYRRASSAASSMDSGRRSPSATSRASSLADYVRAVSQVLLWPAGYTDDPCDGLAEAAQVLAGQATTKGRQALLEDVVRQQKQYCGP